MQVWLLRLRLSLPGKIGCFILVHVNHHTPLPHCYLSACMPTYNSRDGSTLLTFIGRHLALSLELNQLIICFQLEFRHLSVAAVLGLSLSFFFFFC